MALPIPAIRKNWTMYANQTVASSSNKDNDRKQFLVGIKNAFKSATWTPVASSNAGSVSLTSDLWIDSGSITFSTGAHSWIVLQQPGIFDTFQVCLDCNSTTTSNLTIVVSPYDGFTDNGTSGSRPTAADEQVVTSGSWFGFSDGDSSQDLIFNAWFSTDGECSRVVGLWGLNSRGMWLFDRPWIQVKQWIKPSVWFSVSGVGTPTYTDLYHTANTHGNFNDIPLSLIMTAPGRIATTGTLGEFKGGGPDLYSGKYHASTIGLFSTTSGSRGYVGRLYDLWWGTVNVKTGSMYPESGDADYVQFGHLIFPWDGTTQVRIG